jgi:hypothetical protein
MPRVPYLRVILTVCAAALAGYAALSAWVVLVSKDPAMIGDVIGTWKSFAVAAVMFWIGSSSGGKSTIDKGDQQ